VNIAGAVKIGKSNRGQGIGKGFTVIPILIREIPSAFQICQCKAYGVGA
jgi:hypothetical protein